MGNEERKEGWEEVEAFAFLRFGFGFLHPFTAS